MIKKIQLKKYRAISQVISIILLIGLTVLAGAALFMVVIPLLNSQNQIIISTSVDAVFATTEKTQLDPFIDTMTFQVSNEINEPVMIDLTTTYLYNVSNGQRLYQWQPLVNNTEPVLSGQQRGLTIEFQTPPEQNNEEFLYGQQVYAELNVTKYGQDNWSIIKSNVYNVSTANAKTIFDVSPVNHFTQSGTTVFFAALPNETIQTNLSIAIWNKGNPSEPHTKTISLDIENETFFNIDPNFKTQSVTIPASNQIGTGGVCSVGLPCVNVNFPITRVNLAAMGVNEVNEAYGALVTLSGNQFYSYTLNITAPRLVSLVLPDSLVAPGTGNGRIANSNLIYNGPYNANNSLDLSVTIWNNDTDPLDANIFLSGLNTTAFALDSPNVTSVYVPSGILPTDLSTCNTGDPCTTVTWTITRLPLKNGNQETGVIAGAYDVLIRFLEFDVGLPVVLYINGPGSEASPYIYVHSVNWSQSSKTSTVSSDVEIWDANFNVIKNAFVTATWKLPGGSTISESGSTNNKGIATFQETLVYGENILTITNVSLTGKIYDPSRNGITNNQSSYTVNANSIYVNSFSNSITKKGALQVNIVINDQTNNGISGVLVTIMWEINSVNQTNTVTATTSNSNPKGTAIFSISNPVSGTYKVYLISVVLTNYDYDSLSNNVSFPQTITV